MQVKGGCFPVVWGPQGVCTGPAPLPGLLSPSPPGWDRRDTAAQGCTKAQICAHPAQASPGSLGVGLDVGQEAQQKPLVSWAVRAGQAARGKDPKYFKVALYFWYC